MFYFYIFCSFWDDFDWLSNKPVLVESINFGKTNKKELKKPLTFFLSLLYVAYPKAALLFTSTSFLLYMNVLPNISDKLKFISSADDIDICYESDNLMEIEITVKEELKKLCWWLNLNRLVLNVGKTNFVTFRTNKS